MLVNGNRSAASVDGVEHLFYPVLVSRRCVMRELVFILPLWLLFVASLVAVVISMPEGADIPDEESGLATGLGLQLSDSESSLETRAGMDSGQQGQDFLLNIAVRE